MKIILFTFNERKAAQAAARLIGHSGGEINYLALMKLLYLVDREALIRFRKTVTGDRVVAMKHGPVLSRICDLVARVKQELPDSEWHQFIPRPNSYVYTVRYSGVPETSELSQAEVALIDEIFVQFRHLDEWGLVDYCHKLPEWQDPQEISKPISFEAILRAARIAEEEIQGIAEESEADRTMESLLRKAH